MPKPEFAPLRVGRAGAQLCRTRAGAREQLAWQAKIGLEEGLGATNIGALARGIREPSACITIAAPNTEGVGGPAAVAAISLTGGIAQPKPHSHSGSAAQRPCVNNLTGEPLWRLNLDSLLHHLRGHGRRAEVADRNRPLRRGLALSAAAPSAPRVSGGGATAIQPTDVSIAVEAAASQDVGVVLVDADVRGGPSQPSVRTVEAVRRARSRRRARARPGAAARGGPGRRRAGSSPRRSARAVSSAPSRSRSAASRSSRAQASAPSSSSCAAHAGADLGRRASGCS